MRPWHHRSVPGMLVTIASLATVALLAAAAGVSAQGDVDPCALLPADVVSANLGTAGDPLGDGATYCNWSGELSSLSLVIDATGFDGLVAAYPGGEAVDVGDVRAYRFGSDDPGFSLSTVIAPMGERAIMLTVASSDPDVDAAVAALDLAAAALAAQANVPAESSSGPAAATASPEFVLWCDGFTAEEVASAVGVDVTAMPNTTVPWSCGWISGPDGTQVAIELNQLDAATIARVASDFGGEPVELASARADDAWWAADFDVLHVLAGDIAFHVSIGSDGELDDATARTMAIAVAEAFLAEP